MPVFIELQCPADYLDLERYPVTDLDSPGARAMIEEQRKSLSERGVAILPGFVKSYFLAVTSRLAEELKTTGHLEDGAVGTPYLELPDESYPEGHPRRTTVHSKTWVIAYDLIPPDAPLRRLYEWGPLMEFVSRVIEREPLYRMADPLGALNLAVMDEEHVQGWHYDNADFVVSLAIQSSEGGGEFECAPFLRSAEDEGYDAVAEVLGGDPSRLEILPMTAGTLMIFAGRNSLHRVSPVVGSRPRHVALFAYDEKPDADSSDVFKMIRYGRSEPIAAD